MKTPEEHLVAARERQLYGCTEPMLDALVNGNLTNVTLLATTMLSDAQECIENGMKDVARRLINQAKYVIRTHLIENEAVITALIQKEDLPF